MIIVQIYVKPGILQGHFTLQFLTPGCVIDIEDMMTDMMTDIKDCKSVAIVIGIAVTATVLLVVGSVLSTQNG